MIILHIRAFYQGT